MAGYAPWKALERRHAKRMGGERLWRPDFGDSIPDGQTDADTWDCKVRTRFSVIEMFVRAERLYRSFTNERRFHLCLYGRDQKAAGDFVLLRAEDFAELVASEERLAELLAQGEYTFS